MGDAKKSQNEIIGAAQRRRRDAGHPFLNSYKFPRLPVSFQTFLAFHLAGTARLCYDIHDAGFSISSAIILTKAMLRGMLFLLPRSIVFQVKSRLVPVKFRQLCCTLLTFPDACARMKPRKAKGLFRLEIGRSSPAFLQICRKEDSDEVSNYRCRFRQAF